MSVSAVSILLTDSTLVSGKCHDRPDWPDTSKHCLSARTLKCHHMGKWTRPNVNKWRDFHKLWYLKTFSYELLCHVKRIYHRSRMLNINSLKATSSWKKHENHFSEESFFHYGRLFQKELFMVCNAAPRVTLITGMALKSIHLCALRAKKADAARTLPLEHANTLWVLYTCKAQGDFSWTSGSSLPPVSAMHFQWKY